MGQRESIGKSRSWPPSGTRGVGPTVVGVCREAGISEQMFYVRKHNMRGGLSELRHLREEHTKLKRLVADLSLDRHVYAGGCAKKLLDSSRDTAHPTLELDAALN